MSVTKLPRIFTYNEMSLVDPDPAMTVDQVKEFYAETYPELTQAEISRPKTTAAGMAYEFDKIAGSKGAKGVITVQDLAAGVFNPVATETVPEAFQLSDGLVHIVISPMTNQYRPMMPPSATLEMI